MENVKMEVKGRKLHIEVDLDHDGGISGSGKSQIVGSTNGNAAIADVKVGLNVYRPRKS